MIRLLALFAAALAAIVLTAGCGGSSSSSSSSTTGGGDTSATSEWASNLCSAITTWTGSLSSSVSSLKDTNLSKDSLQSVAGDAESATETFVDDLKGLGKPDTEAGQEAKKSLDGLADELQADVKTIKGAVDDISGASGVISAVSTVTTTLVSMGNQLSTTFQSLEQLDAKGELEDAFKQADSCDELTKSGS